MRLGKVAQINIGVSDLKASLEFYSTLGFTRFEESDRPYPWARISDGQNLILLNQDGNQYIGLVYFSKDAARRVAELEQSGIKFVQRREKEGRFQMAVFIGPGGLVVGLNSSDPANLIRPNGQPVTRCGTFGELAISVRKFAEAIEFWRTVGFSILSESNDPYPRGIVSDERIILGVHQNTRSNDPITFRVPALTYFAPDMASRIGSLKDSGIVFDTEITSEEGVVMNASVHGPDREMLFLFEGEI